MNEEVQLPTVELSKYQFMAAGKVITAKPTGPVWYGDVDLYQNTLNKYLPDGYFDVLTKYIEAMSSNVDAENGGYDLSPAKIASNGLDIKKYTDIEKKLKDETSPLTYPVLLEFISNRLHNIRPTHMKTRFARDVFSNKDNGVVVAGVAKPTSESSQTHRLNSLLSGSNMAKKTSIPLWHSGFKIALQNIPSGSDGILLDMLNDINVGDDIYGVHYTNMFGDVRNFKAYDAILEYVNKWIGFSTLNIPEGEDIGKYISLLDVDILIAGLWDYVLPGGHKVSIPCKNYSECNSIWEAKVSYKDMVVVKTDPSTLALRIRMNSDKVANEYSVTDIDKYRVDNIPSKTITMDLIDDDVVVDNISIVLNVPLLRDACNKMDIIIATLVTLTETRFLKDSKEDLRGKLKNIQATDNMLALMTYVERIYNTADPENTSIYEISAIYTYMDNLRKFYPESYFNLFIAINEYIKERIFAMVGFQTYLCDACESNPDIAIESGETVAVNILNVFTVALSQQAD